MKEEVIPSVQPLRKRYVLTSSHGGKQIKCGCQWSVSVYRWKDGSYRLGGRNLNHTGPVVLPPPALTSAIDSLRNISPKLEGEVRRMLSTGMRCTENERRYLQLSHGVQIEREVYRNLIKKLKRELGIVDSTADFKGLLEWLQSQMHSNGAVARMQVEDDRCISGVLYMSADMRHHLDRDGQVLVMDTTFKTNRFHWPLLLVCGVDEHYHTVLFAVAILHHQTTSAFEWTLNQVKSSVSGDVWSHVACVFTDGDAAMSAALASALPDARHLRCRYHLEVNLRSNLHKKLSVVAMEKFIDSWKAAINLEREPAFIHAKEKLHNDFADATSYLERNHWPQAQQFAECYISNVTTFGIRSTARVESWNALLKGALQVNSTTALPILFQALQFAASEVDRRKLKAAVVEAARLPVLPRKRTFAEEVTPHLTYFAQQKVQLQFDLQHNYQFEQKTVAGADSVWYVWDKRPTTPLTAAEEKRDPEVLAKDDCMRCSCNFPVTYLLPCRHVLAINLHLRRVEFNRGQVGQRWLRNFKPVVVSEQTESATGRAGVEPPPPLPIEPIPSLNLTGRYSYLQPCQPGTLGTARSWASP